MALGQAISAGAKATRQALKETKKPVLSATAIATGLVATPEEAEAAYIPLRAFAQGSESAVKFFNKVRQRLNEGADPSPGGDLYRETGVYLAPDGEFKVDVPELRARDLESAKATAKFATEAEKFLQHGGKGLKQARNFKITDFVPDNSPVFEYFPELKDVKVVLKHATKKEAYNYGSYRPGTNTMTLNLGSGNNTRALQDVVSAFDTMFHEFQHASQARFGTDFGSTPGAQSSSMKRMAKDYREAVANNDTERVEQLERILTARNNPRTAEEIVQGIERGGRDIGLPFEFYVRGLGEAEAKSTGLKGLMVGEERANMGVYYPDADQTARSFDSGVVSSRTTEIPSDQILVNTDPDEFKNIMGLYAERSAVDPKTKLAKGVTAAGSLAALNALAEPVDEFSGIARDVNMPPAKVPINYDGTVTSEVAKQLGVDPFSVAMTPVLGEATGAADMVQMAGEAFPQDPTEPTPEVYDEFSDIPRGLAADPLLEEAKRQSTN